MTEDGIIKVYSHIKKDIEDRLNEFDTLWKHGSSEELFIELVFCLFTPQSNARQCWKAVEILCDRDLIFSGSYDEIQPLLNIVRFRNNKTGYLLEARENFILRKNCIRSALDRCDTVFEKRKWLVDTVKGIGCKEASHYLRNIGLGRDMAILDRHILKNMALLGIIDSIPRSIGPSLYLELEHDLRQFSEKIDIPLGHLDFILWYNETGDIFK